MSKKCWCLLMQYLLLQQILLGGYAQAATVSAYDYSTKEYLQEISENLEHTVVSFGTDWCVAILHEPAIKVWLSEQFTQRFQSFVVVNADALNARRKPNLQSTVLMQLNKGANGRYLQSKNGFVEVLLNQDILTVFRSDSVICYKDNQSSQIEVQPKHEPIESVERTERSKHASPQTLQGVPTEKEPQLSLKSILLSGARKPLSEGAVVFSDGDDLFLPQYILEEAHINITEDAEIQQFQDSNYVSLSSLSSLNYEIDETNQSVQIEVETAGLIKNEYLGVGSNARNAGAEDNIFAGFLDYRFSASGNEEGGGVGVFFEPGVTFPKSTFVTQFFNQDLSESLDLIRLESRWIKDFQSQRLRLAVGDMNTTSARGDTSFTSGYRFGGIQIGTNFALAPGEITYPLPSIYGEASSKSSLELYINDSLRFQGSTRPGPFSIERPGLISGSGNMQLVVRDLLGRESVIEKPFQVSPRLLTPGLVDWQFNVGALRENFARKSNDYGESFGSFRYRRGVTDWLTAQGMFEYSNSYNLWGISSSVLVPTFGLLSLGLMDSKTTLNSGRRINFGLENQYERINYAIRATRSDAGFQTLGTLESLNEVEQEGLVAMGLRLSKGLNASLSYVTRSEFDGSDYSISRILVSKSLGKYGRLSLSTSLIQGQDLRLIDGEESFADINDISVNAVYVYNFGNRKSLTISQDLDRERGVQEKEVQRTRLTYRKSRPLDLGTGYSVTARYADSSDREVVDGTLAVQKNTILGDARANVRIDEDQNYSYFSDFEGSLVVAEGRVMGQRSLQSGFAVVNLEDSPGVTIYKDNRPAAITNSRGVAVVTGLQPYNTNRLSIRDYELPIEASIDSLDVELVPRHFGAVQGNFGVSYTLNQLTEIVSLTDDFLPAGTKVRSKSSDSIYYVAYDGRVYLTNLNKGEVFVASLPNGDCEFSFRDGDYKQNETVRKTCLPVQPMF